MCEARRPQETRVCKRGFHSRGRDRRLNILFSRRNSRARVTSATLSYVNYRRYERFFLFYIPYPPVVIGNHWIHDRSAGGRRGKGERTRPRMNKRGNRAGARCKFITRVRRAFVGRCLFAESNQILSNAHSRHFYKSSRVEVAETRSFAAPSVVATSQDKTTPWIPPRGFFYAGDAKDLLPNVFCIHLSRASAELSATFSASVRCTDLPHDEFYLWHTTEKQATQSTKGGREKHKMQKKNCVIDVCVYL